MKSQNLKLHPLCELFPVLPELELAELGADIKANKQRDPITTLDGKILDGRNRYLACRLVGIAPKIEKFKGGDPLAFVISKNFSRRHLNESQRAMLAAEISKLKQGRNSNAQDLASEPQAAEQMNVSRTLVQTAKKVVKKGSKNVQRLVRSGEVSVTAAAAISTHFSKEKQTKIAARGADAVKKAASRLQQKPRGGFEPAKDLPPLVPSVTRDTADVYTTSSIPKRGTLPPKRTDTPPENERAKDVAELIQVTDKASAVKRLEQIWEDQKPWFNLVTTPMRPPRAILDKLIEGMNE